MPLAYWIHNISPYIFRFSNGWGPRWYGFAYLLGFLAAYVLLIRMARRPSEEGKQGSGTGGVPGGFAGGTGGMTGIQRGIARLRMPADKVPDLVLNCCIFGVLLGGRLGYCLLYDRTLLGWVRNPTTGDVTAPYWGVLEVWHGGMSAHGGAIGVILTLLIFCWRNKYSFLNLGDVSCMVVPLGLMFGRIANFINGELYGRITSVAWGVKFPSEIYLPTNGVIAPEVRHQLPGVLEKLFDGQYDLSSATGFYDALGRLTVLLQQHNPRTIEAVAAILPARHPSQLYEALLEGLALFLICWTVGHVWRKDGMACGAFLTFYPMFRMIGEYFRVGDTPADYLHIGHPISLGVLYSIPMLAVGLGLWVYWARRPAAGKVAEVKKRRPPLG